MPKKAKVAKKAVVKELPPGWLDDLPREDQEAITAILGKPISVVRDDEDGRVVLEFDDKQGDTHFIYVEPEFVEFPK
jgi:hypothetical protein